MELRHCNGPRIKGRHSSACRVGAGPCACPSPPQGNNPSTFRSFDKLRTASSRHRRLRDHRGFPSNTAGQHRIHTETPFRRRLHLPSRQRPSGGGPPTGSPGARRLPLTLRQAQGPGGVIGRELRLHKEHSLPPRGGRLGRGVPRRHLPRHILLLVFPPREESQDRLPTSAPTRCLSDRCRHRAVAVLQSEISALFVAAGRTLSPGSSPGQVPALSLREREHEEEMEIGNRPPPYQLREETGYRRAVSTG